MTIAAEQTFAHVPAYGVAHKLNGSRLVMRIAQRMASVSMALVALFVWVAPGAGWESEVMLFKLMVSLASGLAAVWFWQASLPPVPPTVEVDVAQAEVRLVRDGALPEDRVIERCAFRDLHVVELSGRNITFWGRGNRLLAEITLSNARAHATLLGALRAEGKLA
ncbi:hypothetical protein [uncultured Sulfitobacter sp.]|uniref:hypothetical protein n=1 Tax=uncultured Sulfitobacter sp. TaxID=191468 RepID=UPI002632BD96|nr:hypothetical protein [uncultured Sulfitobacter sp.]